MTILTLGFDVLVASDIASQRYEHAKPTRERFFLRPEIQWPVSVDRVTCPSIFQPTNKNFPRTITGLVPDWPKDELNILGLWINLHHMLNWLKTTASLNELIRFPVAFRIAFEHSANTDPLWQVIGQTERPQETVNDWIHLGYDIADRDQTSALSGFEYTHDEMARARSRWGSTLNDWGLLADKESAMAFRDFSDERLPGQAPFYVYEIFKIQ
jgi:hypothetical protein